MEARGGYLHMEIIWVTLVTLIPYVENVYALSILARSDKKTLNLLVFYRDNI